VSSLGETEVAHFENYWNDIQNYKVNSNLTECQITHAPNLQYTRVSVIHVRIIKLTKISKLWLLVQ
jgi:hypothetical protein